MRIKLINILWLVILIFSCKEETNQYLIKKTTIEDKDSRDSTNSFWIKFKRDEPVEIFDSLKVLNSKFQSNNSCSSLNEVLEMSYIVDQTFRDSLNYYIRKDDQKKEAAFGKLIGRADGLTLKIITPLIEYLKLNKECIASSNAFNAVWLVSVHNNNRSLICQILPIIEYGYSSGYIENDSYQLYKKAYDGAMQNKDKCSA